MEEKLAFNRFLFRTAFCFIACDGHIDDRELDEIKKLADTTTYFGDVEIEQELRVLLQTLKQEGGTVFKHYLDDFDGHRFDVVQELLLMEVILRVIYVDVKIDTNEVKLARLVRSKLQVPDEILLQRFGTVELLLGDKKVSKLSGVLGSEDGPALATGHWDEQFKLLDVNWERLGGLDQPKS